MLRRCQVEPVTGRLRRCTLRHRATTDTDSRPKSLASSSGSTTDSVQASELLKTPWQSAGSSSPSRPSDGGLGGLVRRTLESSSGGPGATIPPGSWSDPEPVPAWACPRELSQPPNAPRSLVPRVAPGDVCLLNPEDDPVRRRHLLFRRGQLDSASRSVRESTLSFHRTV